jgi:hypothetical protein
VENGQGSIKIALIATIRVDFLKNNIVSMEEKKQEETNKDLDKLKHLQQIVRL